MQIESARKGHKVLAWPGCLVALFFCAAPVGVVFAGQATSSTKGAPIAEVKQGAVTISGAWIRATVPGQQATGGFMDLTAAQPLVLTGFESKVADQAELHEMAMDGDVMRMRAIESLPLPAGQTISLKPGAHHLMLVGLKKPLVVGKTVELKLVFKTEDGKVLKQTVQVPVNSPQMVPTPGMHHHHHH